MITKNELTEAMAAELRICKRLFKMIPKSKFGYRPAKGMRSTEELLRYLSFCGTECARAMMHDAIQDRSMGRIRRCRKESS